MRLAARTGVVLALAAATLLAPATLPTSSTVPAVLPAGVPAAEAAAPKPRGVGGSWRMIFWDGFSGSRLNRSNWSPNWLGRSDGSVTKPVNTEELSCYNPRNVRVRGGRLQLTATGRDCKAADGRTYRYSSGLVHSRKDFMFSYGFAEARVYLPPSNGRYARRGSCGPNWPAFWLNGLNWRSDGEIDVMECLSGDNVAWHYHHQRGVSRKQSVGATPRGWSRDMPGSSGWHTFGVDWRPGKVTYYFDGRKVGTSRSVSGAPHYLVLNLGVSNPRIQVPQTMQVEYVRVWKRR